MNKINWLELSVEVNGTVYAVRTEAPPDILFLRKEALTLVDRLEKVISERESIHHSSIVPISKFHKQGCNCLDCRTFEK